MLALGTAAIDLTGNEFANRIYGNSAANVLTGGAGKDTLIGGDGADIFAFGAGFGRDLIVDFAPTKTAGAGHDLIQVASGLFANDDPLAGAYDSGANVVLTALNGDTIILANLHKADLSVSDFFVV